MAAFLDDSGGFLADAREAARKFGDIFGQFAQLPNTKTRLDHALTIRAGTGRVVGAIKDFAPSQGRTLDEEFEVNSAASGMPVDLVPQIVNKREFRISRYDLYTRLMEESFGTGEIVVLTDQFRPFSLREVWKGPAGILSGGQRIYEYLGCWFTDIGRVHSTEGSRVSMADATVVWLDRRRVL